MDRINEIPFLLDSRNFQSGALFVVEFFLRGKVNGTLEVYYLYSCSIFILVHSLHIIKLRSSIW